MKIRMVRDCQKCRRSYVYMSNGKTVTKSPLCRVCRKELKTPRRVKLIQGYDGTVLAYLLDADGKQVQERRFVQRRNARTITGVRDDRGLLRVFNAIELKRFYRITPKLQKIRDEVVLDDDKGLFEPYTTADVAVIEHKAKFL